MDELDGPAEPVDTLEMSFGILVMYVRELAAHVGALCVFLEREAEGEVRFDGLEYTQTHEHVMALHARLSVLARQFAGPSEFPPPPGDE